jgi:hypothetical protein
MTGYVLILTFTFQGQTLDPVAMGLIFDPRACAIAGAGMVMILQETNPGLSATFTCLAQGEAA